MSLKNDKDYPDTTDGTSTTDDETLSLTLPSPTARTTTTSSNPLSSSSLPPPPPQQHLTLLPSSPSLSSLHSLSSPTNPQHIRNLFISSTTLFSLSLLSLISPLTILLLTLTVLSTLLTLYTLFLRIRSDGLLPLLPPLLAEFLTKDTSIDECLRAGDPGFLEQYGYLAIYFVPGIDVDEAVERLPERRRRFLRERRTWGDILGISRWFAPTATGGGEERGVVGRRRGLPAGLPPSSDMAWDDDDDDEDEPETTSNDNNPPSDLDSMDIEIDVSDADFVGGMTDREMRWFSSRFLNLDGRRRRQPPTRRRRGASAPSGGVPRVVTPAARGDGGVPDEGGGPTREEMAEEGRLVSSLVSDYVSEMMSSTMMSVVSVVRRSVDAYYPSVMRAGWGVLAMSSLSLFGWQRRMGLRPMQLRGDDGRGGWEGVVLFSGVMMGGGVLGGGALLRYGLAMFDGGGGKKDEKKED